MINAHRLVVFVSVCALSLAAVELTPEQRKLNADSFEYAWATIQKYMWEPMPAGVDWQKIHDELKPKVEAAKSTDEARSVMRQMISRLKMTHFGIVPGDVYERLDAAKPSLGDGRAGFELRIVEGQATVVSVDPDSPAYAAGVRPGWRILRAAGADIAELITKLRSVFSDTTIKDMLITRAVASKLGGNPGTSVAVEFLNGADQRVKLDIPLIPPRGAEAKFGFLPTQHVWYESKTVGQTGYIAFNMFLDPGRISTAFGDSVQSCTSCDGIVIDLRGNPGGLGAMSMGMAGWFINKSGVQLGVMKMKSDTLKFTVFPRSNAFTGPLAILVDGLTASTSEIFTEGLKDLGRARVFGSTTAGAALPSVFEKLPNGDGFQYAIANYISAGGKPLEGIGVTPDEKIELTRIALLAGHNPALDAALAWIKSQSKATKETSKP